MFWLLKKLTKIKNTLYFLTTDIVIFSCQNRVRDILTTFWLSFRKNTKNTLKSVEIDPPV